MEEERECEGEPEDRCGVGKGLAGDGSDRSAAEDQADPGRGAAEVFAAGFGEERRHCGMEEERGGAGTEGGEAENQQSVLNEADVRLTRGRRSARRKEFLAKAQRTQRGYPRMAACRALRVDSVPDAGSEASLMFVGRWGSRSVSFGVWFFLC